MYRYFVLNLRRYIPRPRYRYTYRSIPQLAYSIKTKRLDRNVFKSIGKKIKLRLFSISFEINSQIVQKRDDQMNREYYCNNRNECNTILIYNVNRRPSRLTKPTCTRQYKRF